MREIQSTEAKTNFNRLLTEVERGETVVITRHGKRIARLTPEPMRRDEELARLIERIEAFRKKMPRITMEEIQSARREGQKG
jgi:prevent-host-death family protein